ncbi:MAG: hypothetical protein H0U57_12900 [Tatlockia sp.]|nr:hypothetical protein [Tatlockia sp.]
MSAKENKQAEENTKLLLPALKVRKEQNKTWLDKVHEASVWISHLVGGADSGYRVSTSAAGLDQTALTPAAQNGISIAGLGLQLVMVIPQIIAIATSKRKFMDKVYDIVPLLLLTAIGLTAGVLGVLALWHIGGAFLITAGTILGVATAGIALGLTTYNIFKTYVARSAIGTLFEQKVDTFDEIYDYFKALLTGGKITASDADIEALKTEREELSKILKTKLKELAPVLFKLEQIHNKPELTDKELEQLDDIQGDLNKLFELDNAIRAPEKSSIEIKTAIANANITAAWVNFLLATTGSILLAVSMAFPAVGALILGGIGVGLSAFGLFKFGVELKFSWDDKTLGERQFDNQLTATLEEGFGKKPAADNVIDNSAANNPIGSAGKNVNSGTKKGSTASISLLMDSSKPKDKKVQSDIQSLPIQDDSKAEKKLNLFKANFRVQQSEPIPIPNQKKRSKEAVQTPDNSNKFSI